VFLGAPEYSFVSLVSLGHIYVPLTLPGGMLSCSLHVWYENSRLTAPTKTESNLAVSWLTWRLSLFSQLALTVLLLILGGAYPATSVIGQPIDRDGSLSCSTHGMCEESTVSCFFLPHTSRLIALTLEAARRGVGWPHLVCFSFHLGTNWCALRFFLRKWLVTSR